MTWTAGRSVSMVDTERQLPYIHPVRTSKTRFDKGRNGEHNDILSKDWCKSMEMSLPLIPVPRCVGRVSQNIGIDSLLTEAADLVSENEVSESRFSEKAICSEVHAVTAPNQNICQMFTRLFCYNCPLWLLWLWKGLSKSQYSIDCPWKAELVAHMYAGNIRHHLSPEKPAWASFQLWGKLCTARWSNEGVWTYIVRWLCFLTHLEQNTEDVLTKWKLRFPLSWSLSILCVEVQQSAKHQMKKRQK